MKTIKSMTIKGNTRTMKNHYGISYLLHNDLCITHSLEFNYISSLFDKWIETIL